MKKCSYLDNFIRLAKLVKWDKEQIQAAEYGNAGLVYLCLDSKDEDHVKYSKLTSLDFKFV